MKGLLYIRTDMNAAIATGHVMRCLSIADAVKASGGEAVFILSDESGVPLVNGRGFQTIVLGSDWHDLRDGMAKVTELLRAGDVVLVDSYARSRDFLEEVGEKAYTAYIDDVNEEIHPVNALICYAPYYEKFRYEKEYPNAELLLGTAYAPLRVEFAHCGEKNISEKIEKILVLSGGSDACQAIPRILETLSGHFDGDVYAVCGMYSPYYEKLCSAYEDRENIHILRTVENLKGYMELCDIAVTAGGSTLYELCAVGTPAISYSFADNQLPNVQAFDEMGIIPYAGDFRRDDVPARLLEKLADMESGACRLHVSEEMRRLVDGRGSERLAAFLCAHCSFR